MLINQEKIWQKREEYLREMYQDGEKHTPGQWDAISNELSVREMSTMSSYAEKGIDTKTIIGDEDIVSSVVCDPYIQQRAFTAWGKISPEGIARILEALAKKYKVHVQISCIR